MRIVTRPDFDGIVCAVLLHEAEPIDSPVLWVEPGQVQNRDVAIQTGDIMANLPFDERCSLWFDHHVSNEQNRPIQGAFAIAPSAAGVVYDYYTSRGRMPRDFTRLIHWTDLIDSADLTKDQVLRPEAYPFILLSMTVKNRDKDDPPYWNRLVDLLRRQDIEDVLDDPVVSRGCEIVKQENLLYADILKERTRLVGPVSVADFRGMEDLANGNRFLTYSLFPDSIASLKIRYGDPEKTTVLVSIGHSIFKRECRVNVGKLLSRYGGGGHRGAGGCTLDAAVADKVIQELVEVLTLNAPI